MSTTIIQAMLFVFSILWKTWLWRDIALVWKRQRLATGRATSHKVLQNPNDPFKNSHVNFWWHLTKELSNQSYYISNMKVRSGFKSSGNIWTWDQKVKEISKIYNKKKDILEFSFSAFSAVSLVQVSICGPLSNLWLRKLLHWEKTKHFNQVQLLQDLVLQL